MRKPVWIAIAISIVALLVAPATAGGGKNTNNLTQEQLVELQVLADFLRTNQLLKQQTAQQPTFIPEKPPAPPPPEGPPEVQEGPPPK